MAVPTNIFDAIISKCTEMNPSDRMKSVQELKAEIEKLQNRNSGNHDAEGIPRKNFIPPGFRTKTPWKMLTACAGYLFIFWACLSMEVKDATVFRLWMERITALLIMLSFVLCSFNYCNIQRYIPLCAHKHRLIRCLGVLIFNFAVAFSLLFAMIVLESIF